jgi:hypothetical protein
LSSNNAGKEGRKKNEKKLKKVLKSTSLPLSFSYLPAYLMLANGQQEGAWPRRGKPGLKA